MNLADWYERLATPEPDYVAVLVAADWCEENGEDNAASALRYLVAEERWPRRNRSSTAFRLVNDGQLDSFDWWDSEALGISKTLSYALSPLYFSGTAYTEHRNISAALRWFVERHATVVAATA